MHRTGTHNTPYLYWHLALLALLAGLAVAYVWQVNNQAQHTFSIRELRQEKTLIQNDIRDLNWELSSARSLATVAHRAERLALEAPQEVTYVHKGFSTVAAYDPPTSP